MFQPTCSNFNFFSLIISSLDTFASLTHISLFWFTLLAILTVEEDRFSWAFQRLVAPDHVCLKETEYHLMVKLVLILFILSTSRWLLIFGIYPLFLHCYLVALLSFTIFSKKITLLQIGMLRSITKYSEIHILNPFLSSY